MTKATFDRISEKLTSGGYDTMINLKRGIGQSKLSTKEFAELLNLGQKYFAPQKLEKPIKPTAKQKAQLLAPESMSNGYNKPDDNVFHMDPETDINPDMIVLFMKATTLARKHNLPFSQIIKRLAEIHSLMKAVISNPNLGIDRDTIDKM